jgi:hypothetical protein
MTASSCFNLNAFLLEQNNTYPWTCTHQLKLFKHKKISLTYITAKIIPKFWNIQESFLENPLWINFFLMLNNKKQSEENYYYKYNAA